MLVPGELADHCISTYFDEEAHTPVYVIDIKPCPQPVSIDGVFYERRGTSSRHVSEEYQSTFISNRLQIQYELFVLWLYQSRRFSTAQELEHRKSNEYERYIHG